MGGTNGARRASAQDAQLRLWRSAPNPKSEIRNPQSDEFVLTIRPVPRGRDRYGRSPLYRMKGFLKVMLRRCGWRCVSLRPKRMEEEMEESRQ